MTEPFFYTITYVLDKSHFSETYDETNTVDTSPKAYRKAAVISLIGLLALYLTDIDAYVCWFLIVLGAIDALGVRFHKSWWLGRQLISKAANNNLTLTINEDGVQTKSHYVNSKILWTQITSIEQTEQGWLLHLAKGKAYLSKRCLSDEAIDFIESKANLSS